MTPDDDECWMFPTAMFGNKRSTSAKWKRIVGRAISSGSWASALEGAPRTSILDDMEDISIYEGNRMFPAMLSMCRAYAPHDALRCNDEETHIRLVFEGHHYLWFTIGLLEPGAMRLYYRDTDWERSAIAKESWWLPMFRGIVNWLPEIETLSPRVGAGVSPEFSRMINSQTYGADVGNLEWIAGICHLSWRFGGNLAADEVARTYHGDLIAAMCDKKWIKRDSARYTSLI